MASMTSTVIGNHDLVICVNVKNYAGKPVDALFVIQVKNQYGVTEMVALQDATVAAKGEIMVGVKWVPKVPGDHAMDVFAIDDLDSPLILSEAKSLLEKIYQSAIYMTVPDFAYMVNTGHVAFREYIPVATVVVGYNNTAIGKNDEIRQHKVRANDNGDPDFAEAARRAGSLESGQSFSFEFTTPGTYDYRVDAKRGKVIMLPTPTKDTRKSA